MRKFMPHKGQAGIVAVAVTVMVALVITTMALSSLSSTSTKRNLITKRSLQTYYIAMAGIEEANATKLIPASNKCYLINDPEDCPTQIPGHLSGFVYENPASPSTTTLMGVYRYIVVGGNPARQTNGSFYSTTAKNASGVPYLSSMSLIQDDAPFYILSQGFACVRDGGMVIPGAISWSKTADSDGDDNPDGAPSCSQGTLDQMVLSTMAHYDREAGAKDAQSAVIATKNATRVDLPGSNRAFIPGMGWRSEDINFETAWVETSNQLAEPMKVIAYDFVTNVVEAEANFSSRTATLSASNTAAIKILFNGRINYRTLDRTILRHKDIDGCKMAGTPEVNCNITIRKGGTYYKDMLIYVPPTISSQVLLLPPLAGTGAGTYTIEIKGDQTRGIRSYQGQAPPEDTYTIIFNAT